MSKTIYGNEVTLQNNFKITYSKKPTIEQVSVDIDSYLNRKTTTKALNQYVGGLLGFDMRLWDPPHVARLPDGEMLLFDGDHSRALWNLAFPEDKTMQAVVCLVKDKREISELFIHRNKTGKICLTSEELFVHQYHANHDEARKTAKCLEKCGLTVSMGTGEKGSSVGCTDSTIETRVKIQAFRKALAATNLQALERAAKLYTSTWPEQSSCQAELLHAMALIYKNTDLHSRSNAKEAFISYFDGAVNYHKNARSFTTHYKREGGNVTNRAAESIAVGFLKHFQSTCKDHQISKRAFNKIFKSYIDELEDILGK